MSGFDHDYLRRDEFLYAAIGEFHVNASADEEAEMRVHAEIGAGDGFDVLGPAKADRVDRALNASVAGTNSVELNAADFAVFCVS